jgi:cytochrome b561
MHVHAHAVLLAYIYLLMISMHALAYGKHSYLLKKSELLMVLLLSPCLWET